jgi:hypothetical protein
MPEEPARRQGLEETSLPGQAVLDQHPTWRPAAGGMSADLDAPAGAATAEALLRRRRDLELFGPQARAASP